MQAPEIPPDGKRLALDRFVNGNRDVWLMDVASGVMQRFTTDPALDGFPLWSPDGSHISFESTRDGSFHLYSKPASGVGEEQLLLQSEKDHDQWPTSISRDGKFLLYEDITDQDRNIWALPLSGDNRKPIAVATAPFSEDNGVFSPDVRWVAYETNESGRFEIAVQTFPIPTEKREQARV